MSVCTLPFSRSLLVSFRLMCRSTLVSPLLMRTTCHRVSPPRATATELQGDTLQPDLIFKEAYAVKCCLPGQHPEEDDTLVSGGLRKGIGWRRGLIVSLEGDSVRTGVRCGQGCFGGHLGSGSKSLSQYEQVTCLTGWILFLVQQNL